MEEKSDYSFGLVCQYVGEEKRLQNIHGNVSL
jgi:hypothetical protein